MHSTKPITCLIWNINHYAAMCGNSLRRVSTSNQDGRLQNMIVSKWIFYQIFTKEAKQTDRTSE